jgi:hypothetical protein
MRKALVVPVLLGTGLLFFSCATSIPVTVTKPAEINMSGNRVIAVLDFRYPQREKGITGKDLVEWAIARLIGVDLPKEQTTAARVADYTTSLVITTLLDTGYFELISPQQVARSMQGSISARTTAVDVGRAVNAQAIISGELYLLDSDDETWVDTRTYTDSETGEEVQEFVPMISRQSWVGMTYQVVNTQTGAIVASRSFEGDAKVEAHQSKRHTLPSAERMYKDMIEGFMPRMARQLAPYQVRESRTLMKDKADDVRMEQADELVKGRIYDAALEIFFEVWHDTGNVAAGFNSAILYEITGNLDMAIEQMNEVLRLTGERRAMTEYNRLLEARREQQRLKEQL